ncbi:hypothetical protein EF096_19455 [Pseudomonas neustonica]|uniref:Transposase n=1 Tax=Pseudomonas neustonica TaxID=2487346 RepID=A0ABX9XCR8_9PSED|nr:MULTISPECIES: hypothetical protein [Pseudomonas]ROZ79945.1 hypothetical protein EF099_19465 [Pseudomonas sp. SSM44]ROZ80544.1 hypothetical protein EF096_19455 [Pseudomonas neustonica]|tara:strand:- start:564 stop:974 length:411 start_codon:yes stop_codon:yes gene_type:complete
MSKTITDSQLNKIAKMIRNWPQEEAFNWNNICTASKSFLSYVPTRQALSKKPIVKNAYHVKKEELRKAITMVKDVPRPQSMLDAMNKIERLQRENDALRSELAKMAEIAQRFIYNASIAGISQQRLMAPLPKVRRG